MCDQNHTKIVDLIDFEENKLRKANKQTNKQTHMGGGGGRHLLVAESEV
jgi:hypothetical protein